MPSHLSGRIALLEARVSLLERRIQRSDQPRVNGAKPARSIAGPISYSVDQPGTELLGINTVPNEGLPGA
jgi:hypothetical protein